MSDNLADVLNSYVEIGKQSLALAGGYVTAMVDTFDDGSGSYSAAVVDVLDGAVGVATGSALFARGMTEVVSALAKATGTDAVPPHGFTATVKATGGGRRVLKLRGELRAVLGSDSLPVSAVTIKPAVLDATDDFELIADGTGHAGLTYTGTVDVFEEATGRHLESVSVWVIIS